MKPKTVNAVICKKFDDFLKSIEDEDIRKVVEENSVITGGCIASMLLKEKVNDYDIYFKTKDAALKVAQHYVKIFLASAKQQHANGNDIIIRVTDGDNPGSYAGLGCKVPPGRIRIHIKSAGIAGESGTNDYQYFESRPDEEAENYIDNVVADVEQLDDIPAPEHDKKPPYRPVFMSANAISLANGIQLIVRFYGEPEKIHESYDFVHCTNYWTSWDRKVVLNQKALESLISKELMYVGSLYPLCSIIRTRKFLKRGWTINAGQYLKMTFQVSKLNLSDIEVLEDQLIGVDAAYFCQLVDGLKSKVEKDKEFKLDYGYLATIIDKIF